MLTICLFRKPTPLLTLRDLVVVVVVMVVILVIEVTLMFHLDDGHKLGGSTLWLYYGLMYKFHSGNMKVYEILEVHSLHRCNADHIIKIRCSNIPKITQWKVSLELLLQ